MTFPPSGTVKFVVVGRKLIIAPGHLYFQCFDKYSVKQANFFNKIKHWTGKCVSHGPEKAEYIL